MTRAQFELLKKYIDAAIVAAHVPKDVIWNKNEKDYTSISGDKCKQAHDYAEMQWSLFYRQLPKDEPLNLDGFPYCDKEAL